MIKIKNWSEFQHYKDRNPPWIKLSTTLFQDYDFSSMQDASKLLAICIWTLASRYKDPQAGLVPDDLEWIKRQSGLSDSVTEKHLKELEERGFIERASKPLASCKQNACPETETETETDITSYKVPNRSEPDIGGMACGMPDAIPNQPAPSPRAAGKKTSLPTSLLMPDGTFTDINGFFDRIWKLYPSIRDKGHKGKALVELKRKLNEGVSYETIGRGVAKYRRYCDATGEKQPDFFRWIRDAGYDRDYDLPAVAQANGGRGSGYSHETAYAKALADQTKRPERDSERLAALGLG